MDASSSPRHKPPISTPEGVPTVPEMIKSRKSGGTSFRLMATPMDASSSPRHKPPISSQEGVPTVPETIKSRKSGGTSFRLMDTPMDASSSPRQKPPISTPEEVPTVPEMIKSTKSGGIFTSMDATSSQRHKPPISSPEGVPPVPEMIVKPNVNSFLAPKRRLEFTTENISVKSKKLKAGNVNESSISIDEGDEYHLQDLVTDKVIEMDINLWTFKPNKDEKMRKQRDEFHQNFCALSNSGGGIIRIKTLDEVSAEFADNFFKNIEEGIERMIPDFSVSGWTSRKQTYQRRVDTNGSHLNIFIPGSHVVCSTTLKAKKAGESRTFAMKEKGVVSLLARPPLVNIPLIFSRIDKTLAEGERLSKGESSFLQFKDLSKSKDIKLNLQKIIPEYVSAFSQEGGSILFGIKEDGKYGTFPIVTGIEISDEQDISTFCENVIKWHTAWFQRNEGQSKKKYISRLEDPSQFFKVFLHNVRRINRKNAALYVIEVSVGRFPGLVCESSEGPSSFRSNMVTGKVEKIYPEEYLRLLYDAATKSDGGINRTFLRRFEELKIYRGIPSRTRIYEIKHSVSEIGKRFSKEYFGPRHLLEDSVVTKKLKDAVERKFPGNRTGIAILHREMGSILSKEIKKPTLCDEHALTDLFIFNSELPASFITLVDGICSEYKCRDAILEYNRDTSHALRYKLSEYHAEGFILLKGCIFSNDDVETSLNRIISRRHLYPEDYTTLSRNSCERLRDSFTINLIKIPSDLSNQVGEEFLNLLTPRQYDILHDRIGDKSLFIQGVPGTGKTVIALCFIEVLQRETKCFPEEILYFTENATVCEVIRRKSGCRTLTYSELRKVHTVLNDSSIKNVIIDDAQLIVQHKDKFKWFTVLKNAVKRKEGYLWTFYGDHKYAESVSGLPKRIRNPVKLDSIIRSSNLMVQHAKKIIKSPQYKTTPVGHDFDGDGILSQREYSNVTREEVEGKIKSKLYSLLYENNSYAMEDIAVLFHEYEHIPESFRCGQNMSREVNEGGPLHKNRTSTLQMAMEEDPYWSSEEEIDEDENGRQLVQPREKELFLKGYDFHFKETACTRELTISNGKTIKICSGAFNDLPGHVVVETVKRYASLDKLFVIHVNDGNLDDGKLYISYTRAISSTFEINVVEK